VLGRRFRKALYAYPKQRRVERGVDVFIDQGSDGCKTQCTRFVARTARKGFVMRAKPAGKNLGEKAREHILAIAQDLGMSVEDLLRNSDTTAKGSKGKKVRPQY
jgi:hypothetical protein